MYTYLFIFISVVPLIYILMTFLSLIGQMNATHKTYLELKNVQNFHVITSVL